MQLPNPAQLITQMAQDLRTLLAQRQISQAQFVGIRTGGVWVAQALLDELKLDQPLGSLSAAFYRDDFDRAGLHAQVQPSELPFSVDDQHLVLIDDVLMSGRTVRAALNELFDYGRPASVTLACMLDLQARQLPIRADVLGATLALGPQQRVKLSGPAPLTFELHTLTAS